MGHKSCPFCGGEGEETSTVVVWIRCSECDAETPSAPMTEGRSVPEPSESEIAEAWRIWDTRVPSEGSNA